MPKLQLAPVRLSSIWMVFALLIFIPDLRGQQETETPIEPTAPLTDNGSNPSDSVPEDANQGELGANDSQQPDPAEEAFERAVQHENNNELDKAIEDCNEALQSNPDDLGYLGARANLYE